MICLVLFLLAALNFFGIIHVGGAVAFWSWIVGYALLLIALKVRGL